MNQGWDGYVKTEVIDNRDGTINKKQDSFICQQNNIENIENEKDSGLSTADVITEALGGELEVKPDSDGATISFTMLSTFDEIQLS